MHGIYITDIKFQFLCFGHLKAWFFGTIDDRNTNEQGKGIIDDH